MKAFLGLAVCLTIGVTHPARADETSCFMSTVQNSGGAFVKLNTGTVYTVVPGGDRATVQTWLPLDKVQVCRKGGSAVTITDLSSKPAKTITALQRF